MNLGPHLSFLRELFYCLPLPGRTPEEWTDIKRAAADRPTVILVSGFGASERALSVMRKRLLKDEYNVFVLALDWHSLSDGVKGLYVMVERLSSLILSLRKQTAFRKNKIYIVAHSAGGLVARHYIQRLGGSHYCDGLITLATPHNGTWFAGLGLLTHLILKARCLLQMLPFSPFIKHLKHAPYPPGFRLLNIYSMHDFLCPEKATVLPQLVYADDQVKTFGIDHLSHGDFLLSKKPYEQVRQFLSHENSHRTKEQIQQQR